MKMAKRCSLIVLVVLVGCLFAILNSPKTYASTLIQAKDIITNSRPSSAAYLTSDNTGTNALSIANNGSRFLASDSAKIMRTLDGADILTGLKVASQTAALTTVYFTTNVSSGLAYAHVLITTQTAMHTVTFTTVSQINASGKIILTFPGAGSTTASPSATTWSFNGLTNANANSFISYKLDGARTCNTWTVSGATITCNMDNGGNLVAGTTVTFLIGCGDGNSNETTCTTQSQKLINPTKTAAAGTADIWKLNIKTQQSGGADIDQDTVAVGTIEAVEVRAVVDATFTFQIAGIPSGAIDQNNLGCTNAETVNSGIASTSTLINLGSLPVGNVGPNISAQTINITTNGNTGYSLTATSSGQLQDPASGFAIASSTTPATFPSAAPYNPWFGIHPCGADVAAGTWGGPSTTTSRGGTALYGWPTITTPVTLASKSTGPIIGSATDSYGGIVSVEYAAVVNTSVPSGNYSTSITYVATPSF